MAGFVCGGFHSSTTIKIFLFCGVEGRRSFFFKNLTFCIHFIVRFSIRVSICLCFGGLSSCLAQQRRDLRGVPRHVQPALRGGQVLLLLAFLLLMRKPPTQPSMTPIDQPTCCTSTSKKVACGFHRGGSPKCRIQLSRAPTTSTTSAYGGRLVVWVGVGVWLW